MVPLVLAFLATRWVANNTVRDGRVFLWFITIMFVGAVVLILSDRLARRFLPLAALFKLSLVFPDTAPSRFSMAMRTGTTRQLERRIADITETGLDNAETQSAQTMLEMVAALSTHDRLTRGHSERVRGYTDIIAEEMGVPEETQQKLRWAALLHDVGKLFVPFEILNKAGKPTDAEWDILKSHTWKGDELAAPLADWLGESFLAIRNHHERWDGRGYPDGLQGEEIPIGARIVAVADTYDVMTSKRSYKEPRPSSEAREEIARCAGSQFDPTVARAFLNIGLGRLRMAMGPISWLTNGFAQGAPVFAPAAGAQVASVASAVALSVGLAATASGVAGLPPVDELANTSLIAVETTAPATTFPTTEQAPITALPAPLATYAAPETTTSTTATSTTTAPTTTAAAPAPSSSAPPTTRPATQTTPTRPTATTANPYAGSPPQARDATVRIVPGETADVSLLAETTSGSLTFSIISQSELATVTLASSTANAAPGSRVLVGVALQVRAQAGGAGVVEFRVCDQANRCDDGQLRLLGVNATTTTAVTLPTTAGTAALPPPNSAPSATGATSLTMASSTDAVVAFNASDPDGDPLTFTATGLPNGLEAVITATSLSLEWAVPLPSQSDLDRTHDITIEVSDGRGGSAVHPFQLDLRDISPLAGKLVISEVGMRPGFNEDGFVEVANVSNEDVDYSTARLGDYKLGTSPDTWLSGGNNSFNGRLSFGPSTILAPGETVIVWMRPRNRPPGLPPIADAPGENRHVAGYIGEILNPDGDDIWLIDELGRMVDYVAWGSNNGINGATAVPVRFWDDTHQASLASVATGQSISLAVDGSTINSGCWEPTESGAAASRCSGAFTTVNTDVSLPERTSSAGRPNR